MSHTGIDTPDRLERLRGGLAPPAALLASTMGTFCLLNVRSVLRSLPALTSTDARFVGWVGIGALLCITAAAVALLAVERVGAGPPLALGAAAGAVGLSLGHNIQRHGQLPWAIVVCSLAAGALLGGGAGMSSTFPGPRAVPVSLAWAAPLVAAWPLLTRLATDRDGRLPDVVVYPDRGLLTTMTVVIIAWGLVSMLDEPVPPGGELNRRAWEDSWSVLMLVSAVSAVLATLVGFEPTISLVWARPVVIAATGAGVVAWALVGVLLPSATIRLAYVAVSSVVWLVPTTVSIAVGVADASQGRLGWPVVLGLIAAGAAGAAVGWLGPLTVVPLGLGIAALACLPVWVMSEGSLAMSTSTAPLVAAATAVIVGAFRLVVTDSRAMRWIAMAAICALVIGQLDVIPLSWALSGDVPGGIQKMQSAGHLWAGLTFAGTSLGAALTWVARGRVIGSAVPMSASPLHAVVRPSLHRRERA